MIIPRHHFLSLSSGKVNSILIFKWVVILPAWVCHCSIASFLGVSLFISLTIIIVELHPLSNSILNFLNLALPFCIYIHPCRMGD